MQGEIDTSFMTSQRDLFTSGLAAQIGMNAFGTWLAIKSHADFNTGACWPGMRRLAEKTGLSLGAVQKCVKVLLDARLLRIAEEGKGRKSAMYVARERLDVRLGKDVVVCTIVIDYVPNRLREQLTKIQSALAGGEKDPEAFAQVDIIPGPGFIWDESSKMLKADIPAASLPKTHDEASDALLNDMQKRVLALKDGAPRRKH